MKKHYETHVEDTDKLISVAGPVLDYKSWYEQYRKLMEEQAQRKYGLYTPTSEGDDDDFPSIPGMIARYSALGLTNEQMAANPVWVDKTGNGHDLQMKNFAWSGMSGVGGYVQNFNAFRNNTTVDKVRIDEQGSNSIKVTILTTRIGNAIYIPKNIYQFNKSYFIKISSEGYNEGDLFLSFYAPSTSTATTVKVPLNPNGITEIPAIKEDDFLAVYLFNAAGKVGSITIEQLPLYPGALVFDGVDDYGVCENFPILTKEKGYTVVALRQWITYNPNAISAIATNASDRSFNGAFTFENHNKGAEQTISYGAIQISLQYSKSPFSWQTTSKYNGVNIANGNKDATNSLVLGRSYPQRNDFANFAIWELVFLDHDATEEELTKIKDYFVKTYPWLFPDQAWTVTGKTNEDEDRATIANITGNGNDLVLSNFGFAEGSGYGLYKLNFNNWFANSGSGNVNIVNVVNPHKIVLEQSQEAVGAFFLGKNVSYSGELKISVSNKPSDIELSFGSTALGKVILNEGINIVKINPVNTSIGFFTNKAFEAQNIIIEQIPEYEGYLVTDGVDDKITSSAFEMGKDFTIVGDWKFIIDENKGCGLVKVPKLFIYNSKTGLDIYINSNSIKNILSGIKGLNAVCSDGRVYDCNWNEISVKYDNMVDINRSFLIANSGNIFTKTAFKNLGIYNNQLLSKEDCIKAYNYLQTLKAK